MKGSKNAVRLAAEADVVGLEAKMAAQINASSPGVRVVLGGTGVLNSTSFLEEVEEAVDAWPEPRPDTAAGRLRKEVGRA